MKRKHFVCWLTTEDGKKRFEGRAGTQAAAKKKAEALAKKHGVAKSKLKEETRECVSPKPQTFKGREP